MGSIHLYSSFLSCYSLRGYTGLHCLYPFTLQGCIIDMVSSNSARKLRFRFRGVDRLRASLMSGEGDLLSCSENNKVSAQDTLLGKGLNQQSGIELQPDAIGFGTLCAEITPTTTAFFPNDDEYELDCPTDGFASIPEAVEDIHQGKLVIIVDDEDRENEGDLTMAASKVTPEAMAFIVKHGTGVVCVSMKGEDLERLELPLLVTQKENEEKLCMAFTVSVDAKHGTTTGVSARDRATTMLLLPLEIQNLKISIVQVILSHLSTGKEGF